jgi:hypothetical protein
MTSWTAGRYSQFWIEYFAGESLRIGPLAGKGTFSVSYLLERVNARFNYLTNADTDSGGASGLREGAADRRKPIGKGVRKYGQTALVQ